MSDNFNSQQSVNQTQEPTSSNDNHRPDLAWLNTSAADREDNQQERPYSSLPSSANTPRHNTQASPPQAFDRELWDHILKLYPESSGKGIPEGAQLSQQQQQALARANNNATSYISTNGGSEVGHLGMASSAASATTTTTTTGMATSTSSGSPANNRVNQACATCRKKKVRCDGGQPSCQNCINRRIPCTYLAMKKRGRPRKSQAKKDDLVIDSSLARQGSVPASSSYADGYHGNYHHHHQQQQQPGFNRYGSASVEGTYIGTSSSSSSNALDTPHGYSHGPSRLVLHRDLSGRFFPYHHSHNSQRHHHQQHQQPSHAVYQNTPPPPPTSNPANSSGGGGVNYATSYIPTSQHFGAGGPNRRFTPAGNDFSSGSFGPESFVAGLNEHIAQQQLQQQHFTIPSSTSNINSWQSLQPPVGVGLDTSAGAGAEPSYQSSQNFSMDQSALRYSSTWEPTQATSTTATTPAARQELSPHPPAVATSSAAHADQSGHANPPASTDYFSTFDPKTVTPLTTAPSSVPRSQFMIDPQISSASDKSRNHSPGFGFFDATISLPTNSESILCSSPAGATTSHSNHSDLSLGAIDHSSRPIRIHSGLIVQNDTAEAASQAVAEYLNHDYTLHPTFHRATLLTQLANGTLNRFVWFSLRSWMAYSTNQQSNGMADYFFQLATSYLQSALVSPGIMTIHGLILLSRSAYNALQFQKSSIYWCQATRIALQQRYHLLDSPSYYRDDKASEWLHLNLRDMNAHSGVMGQAMYREHMRRLWWELYVGERFFSITEHLLSQISDKEICVRLPCPQSVWDRQVFPEAEEMARQPPVPVDISGILQTLETNSDVEDNPYITPTLCYGYLMGEVATLYPATAAFLTLRQVQSNNNNSNSDSSSNYSAANLTDWHQKFHSLQMMVQNIEFKLESARIKFLDLLRTHRCGSMCTTTGMPDTQVAELLVPLTLNQDGSATTTPTSGVTDAKHKCKLTAFRFSLVVLTVCLRLHTYSQIFHLKHVLIQNLSQANGNNQVHEYVPELMKTLDLYTNELWKRCIRTADYVSRLLCGEDASIPRSFAENILLQNASLEQCKKVEEAVSSASNVQPQQHLSGLHDDSGNNTVIDNLLEIITGGLKETTTNMHEPHPSMSPQPYQYGNNTYHNQHPTPPYKPAQQHNNNKKLMFSQTMPHALLLCARIHANRLKALHQENSQDQAKIKTIMNQVLDISRFLQEYRSSWESKSDFTTSIQDLLK